MHKWLIRTDTRSWTTLSIRLVVGVIFFAHGAQKLFGWFGGGGLSGTASFFESSLSLTPGLFWAGLAGAAEFFGGLLLLLGLYVRFAAFNLAIVMIVAIAKVHAGAFFLPLGMEYALVLLAATISILIAGGGAISADAMIQRRLGARVPVAPRRAEVPASIK